MSKRQVSCVFVVLVLVTIGSGTANAQFFNDVVNAIGGVVNTGVKTITAPTQTVINAVGAAVGSNQPSDIFKPYSDLGKAAGNTGIFAANVASAPQNFLYTQALNAVSSVGGTPGQFVFDVGTFQQNLINQLTATGGYAVANVLRQENPLQITAAPLAAAIRAARQRHAVNAQPIPNDVRMGLASYFDPTILSRAKYAVGSVEITLPNFIGNAAKFQGQDYAVVVDDIIVFNTTPPSFASNSWWWGHEMTHVRQFAAWGVDQFAWNYVRTFGSEVEGEANAQGDAVLKGQPVGGAQQMQLASAPSVNAFGGDPKPTGGIPQIQEYFVAQCFFPNQPYVANYMISNTNRIIVVDPMTGRWAQVGWATPPRMLGVAWSFDTPHWSYAVMPNGAIMSPVPPYGQFIQVGHVVRLF